MSALAVIVALVIEQWRPLGERKSVQAALGAWGGWLEQSFNGGQARHGVIAWFVGVLPWAVLAAVLYGICNQASTGLALAFDIAVLYLTLGFRQFSHYFTGIQLAVRAGDLERARALLDAWRGASGVVYTREELIRLSIEQALVSAHRHVFGVLLWYLLLPGPSGAVLYRLAAFCAERWKDRGPFGQFALRAFRILEWPAVRLAAAAFAVVGDFEDTVYCWRTQAASWPDREEGILLAAGAGAMGVRLGMPVQDMEGIAPRPELGVGDPADAHFLDSAVGLLWRAVLLWVGVLLLLTLARLL